MNIAPKSTFVLSRRHLLGIDGLSADEITRLGVKVHLRTPVDPDLVIDAHPDEAARFRAGSPKLMGFFVGAVMKETGGKANPKTVNASKRVSVGQSYHRATYRNKVHLNPVSS
jgi:hypothetical protein